MTESEFEGEIAALGGLTRSALARRWQTLFRTEPPKAIRRSLLALALAYEMQRRRYGGLGAKPLRRMRALAGGRVDVEGAARLSPSLRPGARLVREWNGSVHTVEVQEHGFDWDGKSYRSLSGVARAITGARWSGPRFFGLNPAEIP